MNIQQIREKMQAGVPTIGTWAQLPCPDVACLLAGAGYDWVAVDLEHGAFTRAMLPDMFRAIVAGGSLPFARLAAVTCENIKAALDSGAQGLIFPMVETREQLDEAIAWSLYPDQGGKRGVGFACANQFGKNLSSYMGSTAKDILLVAQIEHKNAIDQLDEILSHPRLDALMVGPYDLSGSLGVTGQMNHPDMLDAMDKIASSAIKNNIPMGQHVVSPDISMLEAAIAQGSKFIAYGIDTVFLYTQAMRPEVL